MNPRFLTMLHCSTNLKLSLVSFDFRQHLSSLRLIYRFCSVISLLHQGAGGRADTNLVQRGAWFSRSEVKTDSHWVHNSIRVLAGLRNNEDSKLSWWKESSSMFWRLRKSILFFGSAGLDIIIRLMVRYWRIGHIGNKVTSNDYHFL